MKDYTYEIEGGHVLKLNVTPTTTPEEFIKFLYAVKMVMDTEIERFEAKL